MPDLPNKVDAATVLPLGLADKLVMSVDKPQMLPVDGHLIGNPNKAATGSYNLLDLRLKRSSDLSGQLESSRGAVGTVRPALKAVLYIPTARKATPAVR